MQPSTNSVLPALTLALLLPACTPEPPAPRNRSVEEIAATEDVRDYMLGFESVGQMSDGSPLPHPDSSLARFRLPEDLALDLLLAEPRVQQPVEINFDHRGWLWVVQYNQYPYPEGSRVVGIDNHSRVAYDTLPGPPPAGPAGADRISCFRDTDGDGTYDRGEDVITGLNITTGIEFGRGRIWVLSPPQLLAYPDADDDGRPDGPPVVHLDGFGLEDTHAVANSLRWGPDGWLYGAQGSTTTARVTVAGRAADTVAFRGQGVWRYHPEQGTFELFAEGGGNTFDTEFDAKGRLYSGDNGVTRGFYYKQGGYYRKNWGKHGALTNPYAFGYLPGLPVEGEQLRFTHAWVKYEGGALPERYAGRILALNPLHHFVQVSRPERAGSTFRCVDEERMLTTDDRWFRPVDIKAGPDGALYLADWSDSRLSHVNPLDTWHKASGRIYRLRARDQAPGRTHRRGRGSSADWVANLGSPNKWVRQTALRRLGDVRDTSLLPQLTRLLRTAAPQTALEALWAIHLTGGLDDATALLALDHGDAYVRAWAARLIGDRRRATPAVATRLATLAATETHPETLGQLAATAGRLPPATALPVLRALYNNPAVGDDAENQLLIWWATEALAETARDELAELLAEPTVRAAPTVRETVLERLARRWARAGGRANFRAAGRLLANSDGDEAAVRRVLTGLEEGLRGQDRRRLPPELADPLATYAARYGAGRLTPALRRGDPRALSAALGELADPAAPLRDRLAYADALGDTDAPAGVPVLLELATAPGEPTALRAAALRSLRHYPGPQTGTRLAAAYAYHLRADPALRRGALELFAARAEWARAFLPLITERQSVRPDDVPQDIVRRFLLLDDPAVREMSERAWPGARLATSADRAATVARVRTALAAGPGRAAAGRPLYESRCGGCHRLGDAGQSDRGPDLTGYDRSDVDYFVLNIVDPSADIREGYVNYLVERNDGQQLVGTLADRSAGTLTLRGPDGGETTLATSDVARLEALPASPMPERLLEGLSEEELRNLFAFLAR